MLQKFGNSTIAVASYPSLTFDRPYREIIGMGRDNSNDLADNLKKLSALYLRHGMTERAKVSLEVANEIDSELNTGTEPAATNMAGAAKNSDQRKA